MARCNFKLFLWFVLSDHMRYQISAKNLWVVNKLFVLHHVWQQWYTMLLSLEISESSIEEIQTINIDLLISEHLIDDSTHANSTLLRSQCIGVEIW